MHDKKQILIQLQEQYDRWEALLSSLSEEQILARSTPTAWSIKDELAHLMAWQTRSVARVEAALHNTQPVFSELFTRLDPDTENVDQINAWIYEANRDRPWSSVVQDWRATFQRLLELGAEFPEKDLLEVGNYAWFGEYPLALVLESSMDHHKEHLEQLMSAPETGTTKPRTGV